MKSGNHPFIDPIKVFRHHYGDDAFDRLENFIDENAFSSSGINTQVDLNLEKRTCVKNKKAPGKTYAHYSLQEDDQEIADVDKVIKTIEEGITLSLKQKKISKIKIQKS